MLLAVKINVAMREQNCQKIGNERVKAGPFLLKQLTNTLKIRILYQTSILYLIRDASVYSNCGSPRANKQTLLEEK